MPATAAPAPPEARDLLRRLVRLVPRESLGALRDRDGRGRARRPARRANFHMRRIRPPRTATERSARAAGARSGRPPGRPRKKPLGQSAEANGATAPAPAATGEHASNGTGRKSGGGLLGSGLADRSAHPLEARSRPAQPQPQRLPGRVQITHAAAAAARPLTRRSRRRLRLKRRLAHLHPRDRRRRRVLAPNPTARHRSAPRGARRFADRNDQVHPADAGNRRPATPGSVDLSGRADRRTVGLGGLPLGRESRRATATPTSRALNRWPAASGRRPRNSRTRPGSSWPIASTPTWRSARMRIACANCLHPSCPSKLRASRPKAARAPMKNNSAAGPRECPLTLNQRVQGSNPCTPTKDIRYLAGKSRSD